MLTLETATKNVVMTKGLFSVPIEAFQFDWDKLNRVFVSTFKKYERFCPMTKTIQTGGGNPITMPEDCIYPKAVGFGNASMIAPQTVTVDSQSWTYNRATRQLSVFTNTGSSAPFQVQYLARHTQVDTVSTIEPFEVFEGEEDVEIEFDLVPNLNDLYISKGSSTLSLTKRDRGTLYFDGDFASAELDLTSLILSVHQKDTSAGIIDISFSGKYKAYDIIEEDAEFFETWYAANILTSLGNVKAVLRMDQLPNDINADQLAQLGKDLMRDVLDWQKEKQHWWMGYMNSRI